MSINGNGTAYRWAIGILVCVLLAVFGYMGGNYRAEAGMKAYRAQVITNTTEIRSVKETLVEIKQNQKDSFTALNDKIDTLLLRTARP